MERHLQDCVACFESGKAARTLSDAIRSDSLYQSAPATLRDRVRVALRKETARRVRPSPVYRWLAYAAALAVVFFLGWNIGRLQIASNDVLLQEIVASHVRSLMPGHLTDVLSSDQHTVKPWFNGRLDFSPKVIDLRDQGFPLVGGRIDYLNHRSVAVLIYSRNKHIINLFTWPSSETADTPPRAEMIQGFHILRWVQEGAAYSAVSDLNEHELFEFATTFRTGH